MGVKVYRLWLPFFCLSGIALFLFVFVYLLSFCLFEVVLWSSLLFSFLLLWLLFLLPFFPAVLLPVLHALYLPVIWSFS